MNWQSLPLADDSDIRAVDRLSFDILRVLVASRQATSPTVRALAGRPDGGAPVQADPAAARVRMLAGHANAQDAAGTFFSPRASDQPVARRGERHA